MVAFIGGRLAGLLYYRQPARVPECLCYRVSVRNVTISLPEDAYRRARILAAERDMSLSALVRDLLMKAGSRDSDFERRRALQAQVLASIESFRAGDRLSREEVHDRDALR
jgi:hypothetical protein